MPNTSATGGYLLPDSGIAPPLEDDALDDFMGDLVAGITGLDRDAAVRPRWQPEPPVIPAAGVNWVSVGIVSRPADTYTAQTYDPNGNAGAGALVIIRHETLELLCSFYGPACQANGGRLRDGLALAQNREALFLAGMGLTSVGGLSKAPELIKNVWLQRSDLTVTLRREVRREYPVLTIDSTPFAILADGSQIAVPAHGSASWASSLDYSDPANSGPLLP
ncbi:MAG: hypothetical protein JWQ97_3737 [Phenylobacterium sp.]|nr:hypothetical protein [Phenylobacterium sp.]